MSNVLFQWLTSFHPFLICVFQIIEFLPKNTKNLANLQDKALRYSGLYRLFAPKHRRCSPQSHTAKTAKKTHHRKTICPENLHTHPLSSQEISLDAAASTGQISFSTEDPSFHFLVILE